MHNISTILALQILFSDVHFYIFRPISVLSILSSFEVTDVTANRRKMDGKNFKAIYRHQITRTWKVDKNDIKKLIEMHMWLHKC